MAKRAYAAVPMKRQLFGLVRGRILLPQSIYQHLQFSGPFAVDIEPGRGFRIHSDGHAVENEIFWAGYGKSWERMSLRIWADLCRDQTGIIIDIGANTGVYALAAAAMAPDAEVIAFEPLARVAARLRHNVALNAFAITVEQMAVSDHVGRLPIYDVPDDQNYSASLEGQGPDAVSYEVEICSLDAYLAARSDKAPGPIKIDVERHEPAAVRGMLQTLHAHRPPVIVEILDGEIGGTVGQLIDGLDYLLFHIDEQRGLVPARTMRPLGEPNWNHLLCTAQEFERAGLGRYLAP